MRGSLRFVLIAAISLDGRITDGRKDGTEWTSREDKRWFQKELDRYNAVIMGRKTFNAIKRPMKLRNRIVFSNQKTFSHSAECQNVFSGNARELLSLLRERGWRRIAIVGGTSIYNWFLKRSLVDEICLTLEPAIFGDGKPLSAPFLVSPRRFHLLSIKRLNARGTLLLHYKPFRFFV